jgi:hypothetical protein
VNAEEENEMEKKTVRGVYDDGELRFAEPVHMEGSWKVEITFVEREDPADVPLNVDPHLPERLSKSKPDRLEELHRAVEDQRPHIGPF